MIKSTTAKDYKRVGDKLAYTIVVTNTGTVALTDVKVNDSLVDLTKVTPEESMAADGILEVGETWTYHYDYTVTKADITKGEVTNSVTLSHDTAPDETATVVIKHTPVQDPVPEELPGTGVGKSPLLVILGVGFILAGLGLKRRRLY